MSRRRAVITGIGPITCVGTGVENFWNGMLAEKSGIDNAAPMKLSARNQLAGTVSRVVPGAVNTEVVIALAGGNSVAAIITNASAKEMRLAQGKAAVAVFKASSVILAVAT